MTADTMNETGTLEAEVAELRSIFDRMWDADMEAITAWQAATGKRLTWPDRCQTTRWLLDQWQGALEEVASLTQQLRQQNQLSAQLLSRHLDMVTQLQANSPTQHPARDQSLALVRGWIAATH